MIDSNHDDEGTIEIYRGPHKVLSERHGSRPARIDSGFANPSRKTAWRSTRRGYAVYKETPCWTTTRLRARVHVGQAAGALGRERSEARQAPGLGLGAGSIEVDVRPPRGMPDSLADLQNYELLMLSNVPATALTQRQMEVARTYVQDLGGGLIMLGGDQSFGLGGYYKTVLEEILPVRSDFEKEKEKPSLAMVLVIDKSGSMGGEKIEMAKEAAKGAVELLGPQTRSASSPSKARPSGSTRSSRLPTSQRCSTGSAASRPAAAPSWPRRWKKPTRRCRAPSPSSST